MAKSTSIYVAQKYTAASVTFVNADSTTAKSIYTASADGGMVRKILVSSDDTSARVVRLYRRISATNYLLGSVSIPIGAGTAGAVSVDIVASLYDKIDNAGNKLLGMPASGELQASVEVAVTSNKTLTITVVAEDFAV